MSGWPYCTERWQRLRRRKLKRDPLCEYCPPGVVTPADTVDHRRPIVAGGPVWSLENLASACRGCHGRKTARGVEAGPIRSDRPEKGCYADGRPLDPAHPWAATK